MVTPAAESQRIRPPPPGPPIAPTSPVPVETRLANGLRVVTVERHDLPIVTAALVARGGGAHDPRGPRRAPRSLAADLLTKGTATRSADRDRPRRSSRSAARSGRGRTVTGPRSA